VWDGQKWVLFLFVTVLNQFRAFANGKTVISVAITKHPEQQMKENNGMQVKVMAD